MIHIKLTVVSAIDCVVFGEGYLCPVKILYTNKC